MVIRHSTPEGQAYEAFCASRQQMLSAFSLWMAVGGDHPRLVTEDIEATKSALVQLLALADLSRFFPG